MKKLQLVSPSTKSKMITKHDHHRKLELHPSLVDKEDELFPEPQKTAISSRTGGFEVPQSDTYPLVDDDTTLQTATVYTDGEHYQHQHPVMASDNATLRSSATTVKMGTKKQRSTSVVDVDDIRPQLQKFKMNLRKGWADKLACSVGVKGRSNNEQDDSCCSSLSSHPVREVVATIPESSAEVAPLPPPTATTTMTMTTTTSSRQFLKRNRLLSRDNGGSGTSETPPVTTVTSHIPTQGSADSKFDRRIQEEENTPKRRNKPVVSFSFQHNESGAGVEVHDKRISPPKTRIATPTKSKSKSNTSTKNKEQRDPSRGLPVDLDGDEDSISSYSYTNFQKAYVDDRNLMQRSSSPGAIRLTAEGLQRHEHLVSKEPRPRAASDNALEAWKLQRFEQRHKVKKMVKQDQDMETRALHRVQQEAARKRTESDPFSECGYSDRKASGANTRRSPKKRTSIIKTIKSSLQKEDVTDVSLAPLNEIARESAPLSQEQQKSAGVLGRFRRSPSQAARAILEKERKAAEEAQMRRMIQEQKEKERIDRKRRAYLEYQRTRERDSVIDKLPSPSSSPRKQPLSSFSSIYLTNYLDDDAHTGTTHELSTLSSKSSVSLPPCKVCGRGERTHIAAPCMHFAFCKNCAEELQRKPRPMCPICFQDVTFACVSV